MPWHLVEKKIYDLLIKHLFTVRREHRRVASASGECRKISFSRDRSNLAFRGNFPLPQRDFTPKIPSPLAIDHPLTFRPEYKRTMSTKVNASQERKNFGHRRTQSLNMPQTQINNAYGGRSELRKSVHNRSSINIANTREYYAAPAYNEGLCAAQCKSRIIICCFEREISCRHYLSTLHK